MDLQPGYASRVQTAFPNAKNLKESAWRSAVVSMCVLMGAGWALVASAADSERGAHQERDLFADTWVATDALGRAVPSAAECGPVRPDKWVGIFYWTWHRPTQGGPHDNTKLIAAAKDGRVDWPPRTAPHHWGEPELGYYRMTDPFVIRKHASLLADAGIDVILFDTTNPPFTWKDEYEALCHEYTSLRQAGVRTPSIAFIAPFGDPRPVTDQLWRDLYQPGRWEDLWFKWEGKPLLLADKNYVKDEAMLNFFTFRRPMPDYWIGPTGPDQWSWLEVYPQHVFMNSQGEVEQVSVGVAQNALPNTPGPTPMSHRAGAMGRSWHGGKRDGQPGAVDLGLNFDEQWRRAMEVDPKFIFVTGWNEWVAGRFDQWSKYSESECYFPGGLFVDQYTQEYSRDCEPMRGGHGDNYYYQLASWVRRFKGVRERPTSSGPTAITIDGQFDDWNEVKPEFRDTVGDTQHRDHPGYGSLVYRNDTGRNDFVLTKAAYDATHLYFFAQTADAISPRTDPHWMLFLLDVDQDAKSGWLGYDFIVNLDVPGDTVTKVHRWRDGQWVEAGEAQYRTRANRMELVLDRKLVGEAAGAPAFDFHWADNIQSFEGVPELGVNGDSAPNRRWNYRFEVASSKQASAVASQTDASWVQVLEDDRAIKIDTDKLEAVIPKNNPKHWMTGIEKGSFLDKATGFREVGDGLMVVDWLMEPGSDEAYASQLHAPDGHGVGRYTWYTNETDPDRRQYALMAHGSSHRKRAIEGPQLCHRMKPVHPEIIRGTDFVAVQTTYSFEYAAPGRNAGSRWTQLIVFPKGKRYFLLMDKVNTVNDSDEMFLRNDTPGCVRHEQGDTFSEMYLSYLSGPKGVRIPSREFFEPFPPDLKFGYRRDTHRVPEHFIRAYHLRDKATGREGPWLAGLTLEPSVVYEAWCSQRPGGIIVMIEEVYGKPIKAGGSFSAAHIVGYFDTIEEMHAVYDQHKGHTGLVAGPDGWRLVR
ncbi:MAG: hypothetical protein AB9869_28325 [Verrucomicrobiia bacterium]